MGMPSAAATGTVPIALVRWTPEVDASASGGSPIAHAQQPAPVLQHPQQGRTGMRYHDALLVATTNLTQAIPVRIMEFGEGDYRHAVSSHASDRLAHIGFCINHNLPCFKIEGISGTAQFGTTANEDASTARGTTGGSAIDLMSTRAANLHSVDIKTLLAGAKGRVFEQVSQFTNTAPGTISLEQIRTYLRAPDLHRVLRPHVQLGIRASLSVVTVLDKLIRPWAVKGGSEKAIGEVKKLVTNNTLTTASLQKFHVDYPEAQIENRLIPQGYNEHPANDVSTTASSNRTGESWRSEKIISGPFSTLYFLQDLDDPDRTMQQKLEDIAFLEQDRRFFDLAKPTGHERPGEVLVTGHNKQGYLSMLQAAVAADDFLARHLSGFRPSLQAGKTAGPQ